jgi:hypothetical protein
MWFLTGVAPFFFENAGSTNLTASSFYTLDP